MLLLYLYEKAEANHRIASVISNVFRELYVHLIKVPNTISRFIRLPPPRAQLQNIAFSDVLKIVTGYRSEHIYIYIYIYIYII